MNKSIKYMTKLYVPFVFLYIGLILTIAKIRKFRTEMTIVEFHNGISDPLILKFSMILLVCILAFYIEERFNKKYVLFRYKDWWKWNQKKQLIFLLNSLSIAIIIATSNLIAYAISSIGRMEQIYLYSGVSVVKSTLICMSIFFLCDLSVTLLKKRESIILVYAFLVLMDILIDYEYTICYQFLMPELKGNSAMTLIVWENIKIVVLVVLFDFFIYLVNPKRDIIFE